MSEDASSRVDNSLLICKLVARNLRTIEMWRHRHNSKRYGPPSFEGIPERERSSREPSACDTDSNADPDEEPSINLTFDNMPKDPTGPEPHYRICNRTFAITFNDRGRLILEHTTEKTITDVQYHEQNPGTRRKFTWMLFRGGPIYITLAKKLHFEVILPDHGEFRQAYLAHRERYLHARRDAVPALGQLGLESRLTSMQPSTLPTPSVRRFYYKVLDSELGRGTFGRVFEVRDASNGKRYAAKEYFGHFDWHETRMLSALRHDHIVSYIEHTAEDTPMLIMEYMKGNNLRKQVREQQFTFREIAAVLHQVLLSIQYMHGRPRRIVHRDIKPENILFRTRKPLHVKLGDFGTAWNGTVVKGVKGTPEYCAPGVFSHQPYDSPVDIWSLGVVILELLWPSMGSNFQGRRQGPDWCKHIVRVAESGCRASVSDAPATRNTNSDQRLKLLVFVTTYMLKMDPQERQSAEFCLDAAMSPSFRLWVQVPKDYLHSASHLDPAPPVQQPQREGNVQIKADMPSRPARSDNSRAVTEIVEQSKVQGRLLEDAPLDLSNRKDPQDIPEGRDKRGFTGLPQLNPAEPEKGRPRHFIFGRPQRDSIEPRVGHKRHAPSEGLGHGSRTLEHAPRLAPYQCQPKDYVQDESSPPKRDNSKRARLAQDHSIADLTSATPAGRQPGKGHRKTKPEPADQRVTRDQAKKGKYALLEGLK